VLKSFRMGVVVGAVLCVTCSGGVAVADSPNLGPAEDSKESVDGQWRVHVALDDMSITSVPNMAATAFTREAYVSATATITVEALDPDGRTPAGADITQRSISLWLQEGCQANVGGANLTMSNTSSAGLSATGSPTGAPSITPSVGESPNPQYTQTLNAGTIVGKNLANQAYPDKPDPLAKTPPWVEPTWQGDTLKASVRNWDLKVDNCAGPVSFRFTGEATMTTNRYSEAIDTYSDIVQV
jgi:hypothetical protein